MMAAFAPPLPCIFQKPAILPNRTKPPLSRRAHPTCRHHHPLHTLSHAIAGAALAVTLTQSPSFPPSITHAETLQTFDIDATSPTSLSDEERKSLKEFSARNTRAAGKTSQLFSSARRTAETGDLDSALSDYNTIISQSPTFAPAYSNRANIYVTKKRFGEALDDYTKCLSLAPLDTDAWVVLVNRGATKLATGDSRGALADMNTAFELNPNNEIVLSNRAGVYEVLEKWDNAIRDYQAALQSNKVQPFWERYGLVLFQRNKPTEALAILKRVANRFDVSDVHAAMAVIYFDRGDIPEAETEWSRVDRPRLFESRAFLENERKWPPRVIEAMDNFRRLKE